MYIGRIVCVARTSDGRLCAGYRVSSRSFPNRSAVVHEGRVSIVPKPGFETDVQKNPYIAYNCVRLAAGGAVAVATNGSQTDPIAEKIDAGMPARDALVSALIALDYEKDNYNTPRIAAVVDRRGEGTAWLGIVREDGLNVRRIELACGRYAYVATYEENDLLDNQSGAFDGRTADDACVFMLSGGVFAERTNAVTAVAAMAGKDGYSLAVKDAE